MAYSDTRIPSVHTLRVFTNDIMGPLFDILEKTKGVEQKEIHHPEGDVFTHSLQVLSLAFRETKDTDLILAAMLHDIGKAFDDKGHDKIAIEVLDPLVSTKTLWLIENHMRFWYFILGEMRKLSKVQELANHGWLPELALLARWDKMGRNPNRKIKYDRDKIIERLNKCVPFHFNREQEFIL